MTEQPNRPPDILIVDDDLTSLQVLLEMVRRQGYRVRLVSDGEQAIEAVQSEPPDLILLDIAMPGLDGYEVCRRLKADGQARDVPIIFISGLSETMDKVRAFSVGGVDYVTKPFRFGEVQARIATHLKIRRFQLELERQNQQLQEGYQQLRQLEDLRDNLVQFIVHDLRTLLMGLHGNLELLGTAEAEVLSEKGRRYLANARAASESMIEMISSLLDVSKMEAQQMLLNLTSCELVSMVREVLAGMELFGGHRRWKLEAPEEPVVLRGDADLLARVFRNLLSNALKFTPDGGCIRVGIEPNGESIRAFVQDEGPGIPVEFHGKIFEKFGQVEVRGQGHKYSTGLGLTFCKMVVEAHGGQIGVESEVGQGSTFWFLLPRQVPR